MLDLLSSSIRNKFGITPICPWVHNEKKKLIAARPGHGLFDCFFANAAILGGGGYLHHTAGRSLQGLKQYSLPARIWQARSIPYVIIGVGAGPALSREGQDHVFRICEGAQAITVRDRESHDILAEAGVPIEKIRVTADLVLGMKPSDIPETAQANATLLLGHKSAGKMRLGLHFETLRKQPEKLSRIVSLIADVLAKHEHVEPIWLFDHDMRSAEQIARLCQTHRLLNTRIIPYQDHWTTAALIAQLDAVITTKLHVGIAAWALGVPPAGYSMHPKTSRFFAQIGRSEFQCEDSEDPEVIAHWIDLFSCQNRAFTTLDAERSERLATLSTHNMKILDSFLSSVLTR